MSKAFESKDRFLGTEISKLYQHRPHYNEAIYEKIQEYMKSHGCPSHVAVDAACGTGLSSLPLATFCDNVLGFDISETQLAQAIKQISPNVDFKKGDAHEMTSFIKPETVDLVTIACSLHWLDHEKFFAEADKILRPGGVLIAYAYSFNHVLEPSAAHATHEEFKQRLQQALRGQPEVEIIGNHYRDINFPFPDCTRDDEVSLHKSYTVKEYIDFLCSTSLTRQLLKVFPDTDIMGDIAQKLERALREENARNPDFGDKVKVKFPIFMLMGQKPR